MNVIKKYFSFELSFWIVSLMYLVMINPAESHFSLCLFNRLGFTWCPGCGIGHSISYLLHGEFLKSLETHWLGTFALLVIVYRILQLIFNTYSNYNKNQYHDQSVYRA